MAAILRTWKSWKLTKPIPEHRHRGRHDSLSCPPPQALNTYGAWSCLRAKILMHIKTQNRLTKIKLGHHDWVGHPRRKVCSAVVSISQTLFGTPVEDAFRSLSGSIDISQEHRESGSTYCSAEHHWELQSPGSSLLISEVPVFNMKRRF